MKKENARVESFSKRNYYQEIHDGEDKIEKIRIIPFPTPLVFIQKAKISLQSDKCELDVSIGTLGQESRQNYLVISSLDHSWNSSVKYKR